MDNARIVAELDIIHRDFRYFLNYVKIVEAPTRDNPGGIIDFIQWPHLKEAIELLLFKLLIVWLKSRQVGASWLLAAYALWYALSHVGATIILFSKGEIEAMELLAKCYRIYRQLPPWLQLKMGSSSATEMSFPSNESSIKAFAATETAGISFTASIVICDEWEEHPYADENYLASKPTRDAGGQFIGVFTVNKLKTDTLAKGIFRDALEKKNDFSYLFSPYNVRPGRDEKWYEDTKRNIPGRELSKLTPELYMEQNYPRSTEEALRATSNISAFDHSVLDTMKGDIRNPLDDEWYRQNAPDLDRKICKIYKPFQMGKYFIAATDTSHGIGKDYSVTVIMNARTQEVVADIMRRDLKPEELAYHSVKLLNHFKNPKWFIEANDYGGVTISTAQNLGYKNFGYQDEKKEKIGFNTKGYRTPSGLKGTRDQLFATLIPAVNNYQISIPNREGLKQFYDVIRNPDKQGRIEAMGGGHDDYPITVGICLTRMNEVSISEWKPHTIDTLTFARAR